MGKSSKAVQYNVLKGYLRELSKKGQLPSGVKLDQASTVIDGAGFVDSQLSFMDAIQKRIKSGEKVNRHIWNPTYDRLQAYYFHCKVKKIQ